MKVTVLIYIEPILASTVPQETTKVANLAMNLGPPYTVIELLGARLAQDEFLDHELYEASHSVVPDAQENELAEDLTVEYAQQRKPSPFNDYKLSDIGLVSF